MTRLTPEPGHWVAEDRRGLPDIAPPEPLPRDRLLETWEIRDHYVAYEGLGYCVYTYIPVGKIADPKLKKLWHEARVAMRRVVEHMERAHRPRIRKKIKTSKAKRIPVGRVEIDEANDIEEIEL